MKSVAAEDAADSPNSADPLVQLRRLIPHLDDEDLDLDAIDGEFYWRCCRPDIWSQVERYPVSTRGDWVSMHMWDNIVDAFDPEERRRDPASWVRLRDGLVTRYMTGAQDPLGVLAGSEQEQRVELRVFSNRWSGAGVEQNIVSYLTDLERRANDGIRELWFKPGESEVIRVAFTFVPTGSEATKPFRSLARFALPHIVVVIGLPLPAAGTIAKLYNEIVLEKRQWGELLTGVPTQQEKRVALRTWAVGLLVGRGHGTIKAMREVCTVLGTPEVTSVQFTDDRRRLIERVPEAQPFLYNKPPRSPAQPR